MFLARKLPTGTHPGRHCKHRTRVFVGNKSEQQNKSEQRASRSRDLVVHIPPTRVVAPAPKPIPIIHSRAFILHHNQLPPVVVEEQQKLEVKAPPKEISSIQDVIQRMDEQLNLIEANPPAIQKALYQVSRGPVGQATSSGISAAARLTVAATKEAVKVAAPLGKWMLQEGMKAAMRMAAQAMEAQESEKTGTVKLKKQGRK